MSDPTIAKVEGLSKQVVDALKVSPALLALMLFMGLTLYLIAQAASEQRAVVKDAVSEQGALIKMLVERCAMRPAG